MIELENLIVGGLTKSMMQNAITRVMMQMDRI